MLEWLKTILGEQYTEDIDKKVSAEIGKAFVAKSDFNAKNEAYKALEVQIAERDKQLEALKKVDAAGLQEQISKLQGENKAAKDAYEKQIAEMQFGYALDTALTGAKVRDSIAVKAHLDTNELKFENGKITGLDAQLEKLRTEADYLFETEAPQAPTFGGTTPGITNGKSTDEMTYTEMIAYMEANPNKQI